MYRHDARACTAIAHADGLEGEKKEEDKIDELSKVDKSEGGLRRS